MKVIEGNFRSPVEDLQQLLVDIEQSISMLPLNTPIVSIIGVLEVVKVNLISQLDNNE